MTTQEQLDRLIAATVDAVLNEPQTMSDTAEFASICRAIRDLAEARNAIPVTLRYQK